MGFGEAISSGFSNITNFSGRSARSAFWWWMLFVWIIEAVVYWIEKAISPDSSGILFGAGILSTIVYIVLWLASLAVGCRRLHDTNKSGWLQLLLIIPCLGPIILIIFWVQPSQLGDNQYGPQPA